MSFDEWREIKLEELVTLKRGYDLPKFDRSIGKYPVVASNGITDFHSDFKVKGPGVITGRSGTLGEVIYISNDFWPLNTTLYGHDLHENSVKFTYYFLKTLNFQNYNSGSSVPTLNRNHIHSVLIRVPKLNEQNKIAAILSSLDDKIELNNAINKNLEEMAQALFKRWFVDFEFPNDNGEPYKSSGGEFEESEFGMIPKGWRVGSFDELITNTIGGDWGKESLQGNYTHEVSCIRGADIPEIAKGFLGKVPQRFILPKNAANKSLSHGDIIIEISGGSPTQSTGRSAFITNEILNKFNTPLICTNFCRVIKPITGYGEFLYSYVDYLYKGDMFFQYENGTTGIKNLDLGSLLSVHKIIIPTKEVLQQFTNLYRIIYTKVQHLGKESNKLSQTRDSLLPKLMSGEIRVPLEQS